jgi:anti-sigma regulatory factor (Ser/Thr protein kinase)
MVYAIARHNSTVAEHAADPTATMKCVISELIDNAMAAQCVNESEEPIELRYHFDEHGKLVAISVLDHGISMNIETLGIALTPFYSIKARAKGSGIGGTSRETGDHSNNKKAAIFKTFASGLASRFGIGLKSSTRFYGKCAAA